jgi:hypothetical protein
MALYFAHRAAYDRGSFLRVTVIRGKSTLAERRSRSLSGLNHYLLDHTRLHSLASTRDTKYVTSARNFCSVLMIGLTARKSARVCLLTTVSPSSSPDGARTWCRSTLPVPYSMGRGAPHRATTPVHRLHQSGRARLHGQTTLRRYSVGVRPADLRNAAVNELVSLKPISRAISVTDWFGLVRRIFARSMRRLV